MTFFLNFSMVFNKVRICPVNKMAILNDIYNII